MTVSLPPAVRDMLALRLVPGIGPRLTEALLQRFGSAAGVLGASVQDLDRVPYITEELASRISAALRRADVDAELALVARHGVRLLARGEADFPDVLREIPDPPQILYCRGALAPGDARAVAIVGSRH